MSDTVPVLIENNAALRVVLSFTAVIKMLVLMQYPDPPSFANLKNRNILAKMSQIILKRHSIIRHASYMCRLFLKRHSIIRHASYMSSIFLERHSIIRHASYMSRIF